jgi:cytidylate kinase
MTIKTDLVITIDGPAGAGKSTVSKALARKLSFVYLDTGALYRAVAYKVLNEDILPDDEKAISDLCGRMKIYLKNVDGNLNVVLDGENVTEKIRNEAVALLASKVSAIPVVRMALLSIQREVAEKGGIVAEGRDMGTVVFPGADCKFYLDANVDERVRRRYRELIDRGNRADYEETERDLHVRDRQDQEREIAPLMVSRDAIIVDSTNISVPEVVEKIMLIIKCHPCFNSNQ